MLALFSKVQEKVFRFIESGFEAVAVSISRWICDRLKVLSMAGVAVFSNQTPNLSILHQSRLSRGHFNSEKH